MKRLVVKIGGHALDTPELLAACADSIARLVEQDVRIAVVHGGGAQLTKTLRAFGKQSEFVSGFRVTDAETRDVALMVLAGAVNKALVAALTKRGVLAVGLSGADACAFRARKRHVAGKDIGFVGEIAATDTRVLDSVWSIPAVPVISSLALGYDGEYYNVNADEMASACASACHANALIFLTDVAGVKNADGDVMRWLNTKSILELRQTEVVSGGMIPKLQACEQALKRGVGRVRILPALQAAVLPDFYRTHIDVGTEVVG